MDRNIFTIRSMISGTMVIGSILIVRTTRHGQRVKMHSSLLQELAHYQSRIFGRFIVQQSTIYFYHEPFWIRLICGRKRHPSLEDCLQVRIKHQDAVGSEFWKGKLDHKMGLLQIDRVDQQAVFGTPLVKLQWYHLRRTDIASLARESMAARTVPTPFWKRWLL
jgi:hypothetical protein